MTSKNGTRPGNTRWPSQSAWSSFVNRLALSGLMKTHSTLNGQGKQPRILQVETQLIAARSQVGHRFILPIHLVQ